MTSGELGQLLEVLLTTETRFHGEKLVEVNQSS